MLSFAAGVLDAGWLSPISACVAAEAVGSLSLAAVA
jgi:hypothetical protein